MAKKTPDGWRRDPQKRFRIDPSKVAQYYDTVQATPLNRAAAEREEEVILSLIEMDNQKSVLDLGCGDGRWTRRLVGSCREYVGVDVSQAFIDRLESEFGDHEGVRFVCRPAEDYHSERKFDVILIIGLISYMNDEDVRKVSRNCKDMLKEQGILVLRNVVLGDNEVRRVYSEKIPLWQRIYHLLRRRQRPPYQLIRRNMEYEIGLFQEFRLLHMQMIEDTALRVYIFGQ